ncbi:MAG: hypothetical protein JWL66_2600 [Sphingomonadales bacterium]|jgi:hypothetical protein|nr:hypothetical protein [Sphingomonadales bacterium]
MNVTRRSVALSFRRCVALGSALWIVVAYISWLALFGSAPKAVFAQAQAQCHVALAYDSYFNAECLRSAMDAYHTQFVAVASDAALIAILPVAALWALLIGTYLWRGSDLQTQAAHPNSFPDRDWRKRIETQRATRPLVRAQSRQAGS